MQFNFNNSAFYTKMWAPSVKCIGEVIALDTETTLIEEGRTPSFVLGQVFAGGDVVYFIQQKYLLEFLQCHSASTFIMHNTPFDTEVIAQEVGHDFHNLIIADKLFDTGLLYQLVKLAEEGQIPRRWALDHVAKELLGVILNKDEKLRCAFARYRKDNNFVYDLISNDELKYAAIDAIATFNIYEKLISRVRELDSFQLLSHRNSLMGAIALHKISLLGIGFDLNRKDDFLIDVDHAIETNKNVLAKFGYIPGQKGIKGVYENIVRDLGIKLPRTATDMASMKKGDLEDFRQEPFVDALLTFQENRKLKTFVVDLKLPRVHTRFRSLLNTGRTSSSNPNIQNLPRRPGVRECFIPKEGFNFLIIDYSTLELCTLAQVTFDKYGSSKMKDLLNEGKDLHRWFASVMTGKPENEVTKDERQSAKAANFGFPGGLGIKSFINFALSNYGISISEEKAIALKEQWLSAFPEMRLYLRDSLHEKHDFSKSLPKCDDVEIACGLFKRIIFGETSSRAGKPYAKKTLDWAFNTVLPEVAPHLLGVTSGSLEIKKEVLKETVATRTGRIRGRCSYCQARNTPFQGLAADGAKVALYNLVRAGYRVVNFIHDEFIIEIPIDSDDEIAKRVEMIVVESMRSVVPDVLIKTEKEIKDRWSK